MRVAITGVSGHVGPFVVAEMVAHGHDVVGVDLRPPSEPVGTFYSADVEDVAALVDAFSDCHAVVHLAAIRAPHIVSDEATYTINTVGATCALEAAIRVGARRFRPGLFRFSARLLLPGIERYNLTIFRSTKIILFGRRTIMR